MKFLHKWARIAAYDVLATFATLISGTPHTSAPVLQSLTPFPPLWDASDADRIRTNIMSDHRDKTADNVIRFPVEVVSRLGLQRAPEGGGKAKMESEGQLNMFERAQAETPRGKVLPLPTQMSTFEEAVFLDDQEDARAEEIYIRAIDTGDCVADAWCNLGVLRSNDGNLKSALDCFAQSLVNDPQHAESHYNMGNLYFEIGDLRVARSHYELAAALQPEFASIHFNLGLVTALAEDYRAAFAALTTYKTLVSDTDVAIADELLSYIERAIQLS